MREPGGLGSGLWYAATGMCQWRLMFLQPEVRGKSPLGRWELASQVPEECQLLANCQTSESRLSSLLDMDCLSAFGQLQFSLALTVQPFVDDGG